MEKVINMDEVLTKAFNEIEQEIQEKYPDKAILTFDNIIGLDSAYEWYSKLISYGCAFDIIDNKTNTMREFRNGAIYITVTSSTNIQFTCDGDNTHYLSGKDAAELCKGIINTIVNRFCIRIPHEPIQMKTKYREIDLNVEYNTRKAIYDFRNAFKDARDSGSHIIEQFRRNQEDIDTLFRYGIQLELVPEISPQDLFKMSKEDATSSLILSVPSSSRYRLGEDEISGEYAISFAENTLKCIDVDINNFKKVYIRDEHWDSNSYNIADIEVNKMREKMGLLFD